MISFIILAAALTFAVAIAIAIPLLRPDKESTAQAPWTALSVIAVLVVGAAASYGALSNWPWTQQPTPPGSAAQGGQDSPAAMVSRLKARLEKNPEDLEGWLMLGRSYMVLDQVPLAIRAYEHANRLSDGKNVDALIGLGEALAVQDESQLDGEAGRLIEKALTIDPSSGKALFYGGVTSLRRGDLPVARQRFAALLAMNPPDNVKPILEQQIAAIDQQLGGAPAGASGAAPAGQPSVASNQGGDTASSAPGAPASTASNNVASATGANPVGPSSSASPASAGPAAVHVTVSLSPKLSASLPASAPLFVFVRDPNRPGPPLAVKRLTNRFPQTVELTSADAMVPGLQLTNGQQVQVVARIARSGTPTAQSGDPFGEVGYHIGRDKVVDIVIDRLTP